jgi:hypothetical protein
MPPLTDYEARIVHEISAWKGERLGLYGRVTNGITRPFAWALKRIVPEVAARKAIEAAYATSDWLASPAEVLDKGGVKNLEELRHKSLELSDRLADRIGLGSQTVAFVDGAVTGAGGFMLAAADVGALAVVALRAIHRLGHCYGYPLDQPQDRAYVLGILMVAGIRSPVERLELLGKLEKVENWVLAETVEALALESLSKQFLKLASLEAVPGVGAIFGSAANVVFVRHVLNAARRIFQERWLRENGKIDEPILPPAIPPAATTPASP